MLSEVLMRRLAFIRYLYKLGLEQSKQPEPLSSVSVLTFHDSAELFLQLAAEYRDKGKKDMTFMGYWEVFEGKLDGGGLTQKESMRRLNTTRVAVKHYGNLPSKIDIEAHRATITNFFEDNTNLIFGVEFSSISMIDLVSVEDVRKSLIEATTTFNKEGSSEKDYREAMGIIAVSYHKLIKEHHRRNSTPFGSIYNLKFGKGVRGFNLGGNDRAIGFVSKAIDEIGKQLDSIGDIIEILLCGIDYKKYAAFSGIIPYVHQTMDGRYHISPRSTKAPTKAQCQFCIDFVIECALRLQNL